MRHLAGSLKNRPGIELTGIAVFYKVAKAVLQGTRDLTMSSIITTNTSPAFRTRSARFAVLGFFFVSGACGLVHEVAWTRLLRLIMGNTTFSITTVLCAFMGGLALGSYLGGRLIDRRHDPLRVFALLEACVGVYCLSLPWLIHGAEPVYRLLYQNTHTSFYVFSLIRFVFSGVILLIPAIFMGATLPVLTRFLARSPGHMGRSVGTLYAVNTFGAVFGAFISGFVLIPALGVTRAIYLAGTFNLLVSGAGFWLYLRFKNSEERPGVVAVPPGPEPGPRQKSRHAKRKPKTGAKAPAQAPVPLTYGRGTLKCLLWGYGISGFAALVYEIAWTRALSLMIGSTVYAFSLMLTAFVLGIALGSMVYARFVDRVTDPLRALAVILMGIGVSALMVVPLIDRMPFYLTGIIARYVDSFWALQTAEFALCAGFMLVPTVLMGAAFPLASRIYNQESENVGRTVGTVYGANTMGNILGAFIGGFVLIPMIGIQNTIFCAVVANVLVGCTFFVLAPGFGPRTRWALAAAVAVAAAASIVAIPRWDPGAMSFGPYHTALRLSMESSQDPLALERMNAHSKVLFHKEGLTTTVTVKEVAKGVRALYINGKPDASSHADLPHQELVAHVPLMFHPEPRSALVIGLASGISVGSAGRYPLEKIDCVEISPAMVEACRYFDDYNYKVLDDPRVNVIVADGRNHLLLTDQTYDVIISQPSNPYMAGVADLFTREYFELGRKHLNDGGIMCTWMQAYKMDLDTFRSIIKTFKSVFPEMSLWRSGKTDCLLIGTTAPQTMSYELLKQRLASGAIADDLRRIGIHDAPEFLVQLVMGKKGLDTFSAEGILHTDDNALVEFSAPRALTRTLLEIPLVRAIEDHREADLDFLRTSGDDPSVTAELAAVKDTARRFIAARGHVFQTHILQDEKRPEEARAQLQQAAALNPGDAMLKAFNADDHGRAVKLARAGRLNQAETLYKAMLRRVPGDEKAHYNLALVYKLQGRLPDALAHYQQAVRFKPDYTVAVFNVGEVSETMGDIAGAADAYRRALMLNPEMTQALNNLSRLLVAGPDTPLWNPEEAVRLSEKASRIAGSENPYLLETLGRAYAAAGRLNDARRTNRQALGFAEKTGDRRLVERLTRRQTGKSVE